MSFAPGDWVIVQQSRVPSRIGCLAWYQWPDEAGTHWVAPFSVTGDLLWLVNAVRPATPEDLAAHQLARLVGGGL